MSPHSIFTSTPLLIIMIITSYCESEASTSNFVAVESSVLGCPQACHCSGTTVDCKSRNLHMVPDYIPPNTEILDLSSNLIDSIQVKDFYNLTKLTRLTLRQNRITRIERAFQNCQNLSELDLTNNKLTNHGLNTSFAGLKSLTILHLDSNNLDKLPALPDSIRLQYLYAQDNSLTSVEIPDGYRQLAQLKRLTLSLNPKVTSIHKDDFAALASARSFNRLYLTRCGITSVEPQSFHPVAHLTSLNIGSNNINATTLKTVLADFNNSKVLYSLDMSQIKLGNHLPSDTFLVLGDQSKISTIDISRNPELSVIDTNTFIHLSNLGTLFASSCGLISIPDLQTNKKNLKHIRLDGNSLSKLESASDGANSVFPEGLVRLELQDNKLGVFKVNIYLTKLEYLSLRENKITEWDVKTFASMQSLTFLDLANNLLSYIPKGVFADAYQLQTIILSKNNLIKLDANEFAGLPSLTTLQVNANGLKEFTGPTISSSNMSQLQTIDLSSNSLTTIQLWQTLFCLPSACPNLNLKSLDLSHNDLSRPIVVKDLPNVKIAALNLAHNALTLLPNVDSNDRYFSFSVASLNLSYNRITSLLVDELEAIHGMNQLDLTGNPFSCGCDLRWLPGWLNDTRIKISNALSYKCASPEAFRGQTLLNFSMPQINCFPKWVIWVSASGVTLLVVIILACIANRYHWKIRFWCHRHCGHHDMLGDNECLIDQQRYAAYVSYCRNDECTQILRKQVFGPMESTENDSDSQDGETTSIEPLYTRDNIPPGMTKIAAFDHGFTNSAATLIFLCRHNKTDKLCELELDHSYADSTRPKIIFKLGDQINARSVPLVLQQEMINGRVVEWRTEPSNQETNLHILRGRIAEITSRM